MAPPYAPQDIPLALNLLALLVIIAFLILGVVVRGRRDYGEAVKSAIMRRASDTGFEPVAMACPKCGAQVGTYAYFCSNCGAKVEAGERKGRT